MHPGDTSRHPRRAAAAALALLLAIGATTLAADATSAAAPAAESVAPASASVARASAAAAPASASPAPAVVPAAANPAGAPSISVVVTPAEITLGAAATVSGRLREGAAALAGAVLDLQVESYPFTGFATVARTTSAPDGSFAFAAIQPDRNTKVRVALEGAAVVVSPALALTVDPSVAVNSRSLGAGRTLLSIRLRHTLHAGGAAASVTWFVAARGTRVFRLVGVTPTRELQPGLSYSGLTIDPPARHFAYRVCVNPRWEHAMGSHLSHGRCPTHDYAVPRNVR
jgi:hypothetical protein